MTQATLWLSQIQFYASLAFLAVFLMMELGLGGLLAYFRIRSLAEPAGPWMAAYRFWVRVFALAFVLSFAAGLPVLLQLGSLWPALMSKIGDVAGPLLAAALTTVFVFKSCFMGAMLFGERRLSGRAHAAVVVMVAVGTALMSFWLLALLSWMHAPEGAVLVGEQYHVIDWENVIFNPALPWYAGLFAGTAALVAAFLVMGVVAAQSLRRPAEPSERLAFRSAVWLALAAIVLQVVCTAGGGLIMARYQPAKAAATAAYWQSGTQPDLIIAGWPDAASSTNRGTLRWRHAGGRWLGRDSHGTLLGLDRFAGMAPPVAATFWLYRIALLAGMLLALAAGLTWLEVRRGGYDPAALSPGWRKLLMALVFGPWAMALAGIAYTLVGAYPFAVAGTITIAEIAGSASHRVVAGGLFAYAVLYMLFIAGFLRMLWHTARHGVVPVARHRGRA
ncbi:cytochrome ubiquinol oxidase subunit I [Pusillimonas sp. TS35]|nr:cytochrome ubiquinol oxidase subunit I [Pusillimonas sp. TS35]